MRPRINLRVQEHRVRIEIDPSADVLSFHYEHNNPGIFSLVQEFPLSRAEQEDVVWDELTGRFVLVSKKKPPSSTAESRKMRNNESPAMANSIGRTHRESRRASGDYLFWSDL
jgi:hypothetical protein